MKAEAAGRLGGLTGKSISVEQMEIARLKAELAKARKERDILKTHLERLAPVGIEKADVYVACGRERLAAFWSHMTPLKNMVHGILRA